MKLSKIISLVAAATLLSPVTTFAEGESSGMYFIGGLGQTTFDYSQGDFNESGTSFRLGIGNKLQGNDNLFWEAYYISYGSADKTYPGDINVEVSGSAIALQGLFKNPTGEGLAIYGKLGLAKWDGDVKYSEPGFSGSDSDSGTDIYFGVGLEKALDSQSAFRFEWESISFDVEGDSIDGTSFTLYYVKSMN